MDHPLAVARVFLILAVLRALNDDLVDLNPLVVAESVDDTCGEGIEQFRKVEQQQSLSAGEVFDQRGAILWSLRRGHRFLVEDRQRFTMGPLQQATQGRSTVLGVQGKVEKVC